MNKKYYIIAILSILIVLIGVTVAYWIAIVTGEGENITVTVDTLRIVFTDNEEINSENITLGWSKTKTFTVENQSNTSYTYNINLENLINTLVTDSLEYKITSDTGYTMENYKLIDKCDEECTQTLGEKITIGAKEKHTYQIEFRYEDLKYIDQTDDQGKMFKGKLSITASEKIPTLADFFKDKYPEVDERKDFTVVDETAGVHKESGAYTEDIDGDGIGEEVYYWTGNVNGTNYDNWVMFGKNSSNQDLWWRIIRTNEDGGLRLLYHGTGHDVTDAYITTQSYNQEYNNTMYVGYMYGKDGSLLNNRTNQTNSSTIKQTIDKWYQDNLEKNDFDRYISKTAIYCNDRSGDNWGTGAMEYGVYKRLKNHKYHPSYKCGVKTTSGIALNDEPTLYNDATTDGGRESDMFSASDKYEGNGLLTEPIALMTADEIVYAGGLWYTNSLSYYYYNSNNNSAVGENQWWTMSPCCFSNGLPHIFLACGDYNKIGGGLSNDYVSNSKYAVRPVLSLKSCVTLTGTGSPTDPYIPEINETCASSDN